MCDVPRDTCRAARQGPTRFAARPGGRGPPTPCRCGDCAAPLPASPSRADRTSEPARLVPHWNAPARGSGLPVSTGSAQALQLRWSGGGGEDQPAHPNAITFVSAHTFCSPLNRPGGGARLPPSGRGWGSRVFRCPFPQGGLAAPPAGAWGKRVSPYPKAVVEASGAPQAGAWGTQGSPYPKAVVGASGAPQAGAWGNPVSPCPNRCWEWLVPPTGRGMGKPAFPMSQPLLGAAGTTHRQGDGETWFPRIFTSAYHTSTAAYSAHTPPRTAGRR